MALRDDRVREALKTFLLESFLGSSLSLDILVRNSLELPFYDAFIDELEKHQPPRELAELRFGEEEIRGKLFYTNAQGDGFWIDGKEKIRERLIRAEQEEESKEDDEFKKNFPPCVIS